jgi:hypothetical protein
MFSAILNRLKGTGKVMTTANDALSDFRNDCDDLPFTKSYVDSDSIQPCEPNLLQIERIRIHVAEFEALLKEFHGETSGKGGSWLVSRASGQHADTIDATMTIEEILASLKYHQEHMQKSAMTLYEDSVRDETLYLNYTFFPSGKDLHINSHAPIFGRVVRMWIRLLKGVLLMEELRSRLSVPPEQFVVGKDRFQDIYAWFMYGKLAQDVTLTRSLFASSKESSMLHLDSSWGASNSSSSSSSSAVDNRSFFDDASWYQSEVTHVNQPIVKMEENTGKLSTEARTNAMETNQEDTSCTGSNSSACSNVEKWAVFASNLRKEASYNSSSFIA